MAYDYSDTFAQTQDWARQAQQADWLSQHALQQLSLLDTRAPETLFLNSTRPLIVAFMGGTGVGKSALLNRLAGKAIAKSGIERPTSREVTLFHHHTIALSDLATQLPLAKINLAEHDEESKKHIIWIDMPDFDSTELANKQQVLSWLPHIDVLIYVVSPERYRDEKAWRLLLAEGGRHAWLFVLNQWDRGQLAQLGDFEQQLHKAGFIEPMIFKTICNDEQQVDDFAELENLIISLANQKTINQLQQHSTQARKQALKRSLENALLSLGSAQQVTQLKNDWQQHWQHTRQTLQQGMVWTCQQLAQYYADHASHLISESATTKYAETKQLVLWDDWAQARFNDVLDELISTADQAGLPILPLKNQLLAVRTKAGKMVKSQSELAARLALAKPGSRWHRGALKFVRFCEIVLPISAMAWVIEQVFIGYYDGNMHTAPYLGVDFAIHSSLLIALTWLIPFFILKKAQPSLKKSALHGLNTGTAQAFNALENEVNAVLDNISQQHAVHCQQLAELITACETHDPLEIEQSSPLHRMLLR